MEEKFIYKVSLVITKLIRISLVIFIASLPIITIPLAFGVGIELIAKEVPGSIWLAFWQSSKKWLAQAKTILLLIWLLIIAWIILIQSQVDLSWYYKLFMSSFYLNIMHNLLQLQARTRLALKAKIRLSISLFIRYLPRNFIIMSLLLLGIYFGLNNLIISIFILPGISLWILAITQEDIWQRLTKELEEQGES